MTSGIYIRVGKEVFDKRRQLRHLSWVTSDRGPEQPPKNSIAWSEFTETRITSEPALEHVEHTSRGGLPFDGQPSSPNRTPQSPYKFSVNGGKFGKGKHKRGSFQSDRPGTAGQPRRTSMEANSATWAYTKCASLFFLSLVVTWVRFRENCDYYIAAN